MCQRIKAVYNKGPSAGPTPLGSMENLSNTKSDVAVSTGLEPRVSPRFRYTNQSFLRRILVGANLKTSLAKNSVHYIEHRSWCKHVLVFLLLLIAVVLTPSLLPDRLGFEWATPRELCQKRGEKVHQLNEHLLDLANITLGVKFVSDLKHEIRCVNSSAARFYNGDTSVSERMLWPRECTRQKVSESLTRTVCEPEVRTEKTECLKLNDVQKAAAFLTGVKRCKTVFVEPVCSSIVDEGVQSDLLTLQDETIESKNKSNLAKNEVLSTISSVSLNNQRIKTVVSEGVTRIDIASSLYVGYTIISLLLGRPLIVFKRGKRTRVSGITIGLSKASFTLVVVVIITVYDSVSSLLKETDLKELLKSFHADPCYADPEFSRSRSDLIEATCERVSDLHRETSKEVRHLNDIRHQIKLFGLCEKNGVRSVHPALDYVDARVHLYRSGGLKNPATCNVSALNRATKSPDPKAESSALKSILGSGVLAQLLAKIVVTNFVIQLVSYAEPLASHGGKVELWGDEAISADEEDAIQRFARDKHLLSLIWSFVFLGLEVTLIAYASIRTISAGDVFSNPISDDVLKIAEPLQLQLCNSLLRNVT